jgi:hypothetical protein
MRNGVKVFTAINSRDLEDDVANWLDAWPEREVTHTSTVMWQSGTFVHIVHYREPEDTRIAAPQSQARMAVAA